MKDFKVTTGCVNHLSDALAQLGEAFKKLAKVISDILKGETKRKRIEERQRNLYRYIYDQPMPKRSPMIPTPKRVHRKQHRG